MCVCDIRGERKVRQLQLNPLRLRWSTSNMGVCPTPTFLRNWAVRLESLWTFSIPSFPFHIGIILEGSEGNIRLFLSFEKKGPVWRIFVQNFGRTLRGSKSPHVPTAMPVSVCYREQKKLTNLRHGYKLHEYFMRGRENRNCERRSL